MKLRELDTTNIQELAAVENIYTEAFPLSERRPVEKMFDLYRTNPQFIIDVVTDDDKIIGLLTYWLFDGFVFAEHFAISPQFRSGGNGGKVINLFIAKVELPIVIEVELPTTILSERRIGFYQRLGFRLWEDIPYQQPAYRSGENAIPMKLMSYGKIDVAGNLTNIRSTIYSEVYNY